jgi:hypothetical protein
MRKLTPPASVGPFPLRLYVTHEEMEVVIVVILVFAEKKRPIEIEHVEKGIIVEDMN